MAIEEKEIERVKHDVGAALTVEPRLERRETCVTSLVEHDSFAVNDSILTRERRGRRGDRCEAMRPVVAAPGAHRRLARVEDDA